MAYYSYGLYSYGLYSYGLGLVHGSAEDYEDYDAKK